MRVILIHPHDPCATHLGGIGTFIKTFLRHAQPEWDLSVVGISTDPSRRPVGQWQKAQVGGRVFDFFPIVAAQQTRREWIPLSLRFTWALRCFRNRICFDHAVLEFHRVEPALAVGKTDGPKVLFLHGHTQDLYNPKTEVTWGKFPWAYFWLERQIIPRMRRIYIVREDAVPFYRSRYPRQADSFRFLPTWVDEEVFYPAAEPQRRRWREDLSGEHRLDPARKWLLFVGRFEGQKDPLLLLRAFQWLKERAGQGVHLILIGEGALESSMRSFLRDHSLSEEVRFLKAMSQEKVARWMNVADTLVLSSAFEGMPRAAVEALQCGLPVVMTDVGEAKRLITDPAAGRLVKERTPEALCDALLEQLHRPPDRGACQRQVAPYTARRVLQQVYDAYSELGKGLS